jgi:hypothetical protein
MIERIIERIVVLGALGLAVAGCSDSSTSAAAPQGDAQQAAASDGAWQPPKTAWGEPDLQGTWPITHLIGIPFERPAALGERRELTDEEFAAVQARIADRNTKYDEEISSNKMGAGHWAEATTASKTTSLLIDPPDGRFPELTAKGKELRPLMGSSWFKTEYDSVADFDSWDRCISRGLPVSMLPRNYNNGIVIFQSPGYVALKIEMLETRVIPTNGEPAPDAAIKSWMGEPRGHWEGNTLVVEAKNFNGLFGATNFGVPGSPRELNPTSTSLHTVERFTRTADDTIDYQITVEDPETITKPFTVAYPMKRDDSYQLFEYACHEDNTAVRNFITTSRFERAKAAKQNK